MSANTMDSEVHVTRHVRDADNILAIKSFCQITDCFYLQSQFTVMQCNIIAIDRRMEAQK